jgi:hypothetical protein
MNTAVAIQLLLGLLDRATLISSLLEKASSEKRDITPEELEDLVKKDNVAKINLEEAIRNR